MDSQEKRIIELQVRHLLENIQLRLKMITGSQEEPSRLDLDGLKDKIRELYDHVISLEMQGDKEESEITRRVPVPEPVEVKAEKTVAPKEAEKKASETIVEKPPEKEPELLVEEPETIEDISMEPEQPPLSPSTKADILKESKTTIADKFMEGDDKTIAAKIQKKPISDLRLAIGVNDKFLFIKELFKGDLEKYNESIRKLNEFKEKKKALQYIEELNGKYRWPEDSVYGARLTDLVERKFL